MGGMGDRSVTAKVSEGSLQMPGSDEKRRDRERL
jgi:hypothetical protein